MELLKAHRIRGGLPNSQSIKVSLLSKPPGYIEKDARWKQWRSSWVYGAPVDVSLPNHMPRHQPFASESSDKQESRTAVISVGEDMDGEGQKPEGGSVLNIWRESDLVANDPFDL